MIVICATHGLTSPSGIWQKSSEGVYEADIRTLAIHPLNHSVIYAGTSKAIYKSDNKGKSYRSVLQPAGEFKSVNFVYVSQEIPRTVYAATDAGLYESPDEGVKWERIYYESDPQARRCLSVAQDGGHLYLATSRGLRRRDSLSSSGGWQPVEGELGELPVYHMIQGKDFIYAATDRRVYQLNKKTQQYRHVFSVGIRDIPNGEDLPDEALDANDNSVIRSIDFASDGRLFLASSHGIYASADEGETWQPIAAGSLPLNAITSLVSLENPWAGQGDDSFDGALRYVRLLAGTERGAFVFEGGRWSALYAGMETNHVNRLIRDAQETVYAATDRGIFYLATGQALPSHVQMPGQKGMGAQEGGDAAAAYGAESAMGAEAKELEARWGAEPTISDVHRLAVDYAEVHPDKIKSWRSLARRRAILPSLSVGLDRGDTDLLHWDTGPSPDELRKGRDFVDWDIALAWDLGDLIWSDDQTSIDTRSKLMVELREDILDQVTRLYFERRRIQTELAMASLAPHARMEKQMRVDELTALIDAFTGGEFSRLLRTSPPQAE